MMHSDEIIHMMATKYFVNTMKRDAKQATDVMVTVIRMRPNASLRFMGETANLINEFHTYLERCSKCTIRDRTDMECIIDQICNGLCTSEYNDLK